MGKDKKSKGKQTKEDPKGKGISPDKYVPSAAEIAEDKQARLSVALQITRKQPAHPLPIKMAPPSAELPLTKLEMKKQKERKHSVDKHSPSTESSEEPVLDTSLIKEEKEEKKTAEVKPGTSPALSTPNSEDESMLSDLLDKTGTDNGDDGSDEDRSPGTDDLLNGITPLNEGEAVVAKQDDTVSTTEKQDDDAIAAENF
jgi:hypothetical protein